MNFNDFAEKISNLDKSVLKEKANRCRGDILTMTTLASSGHPGGSMSSIDILVALYSIANINSSNFCDNNRDRIVVSHGHISPAVYSCLASYGFIDRDEAIAYFRKAGSIYEGHIERTVKGVEWTTGNLGQGLSAGCGMAVASRALNQDFDIYVLMGDGEQEKGQIAEARRFAKKYGFKNITVIVDYNRLQISGNLKEVMPSLDIVSSFKADGWDVIEIDGHNFDDILGSFLKAKSSDEPTLILANTVMGKGVSFMENDKTFHGSVLSRDKYDEAMKELNLDNELEKYEKMRRAFQLTNETIDLTPEYKINVPKEITYDVDVYTDNRSAFGKSLLDIVKANVDNDNPIVVFDCDLASSVKTSDIEKEFPDNFYQCGIAEHHTSVCAGAASINGVVSFFADFGMFGVDEVYNQHRLNGINDTAIKLVTTHVGVDVGEDGKTHMCIDYISLMRNVFGFKIIVPADPNETDRVVRYAAKEKGNIFIAMGRSKLPIITDEKGKPYFSGDYKFQYGSINVIRQGEYPLFTYGNMVYRAIKIKEILEKKGISISVINVSSPAFINEDEIIPLLEKGKSFVYEDHLSFGGLFGTIAGLIGYKGINCNIIPFGVNKFPISGNPNEVFKYMELDEESVANKIIKSFGK